MIAGNHDHGRFRLSRNSAEKGIELPHRGCGRRRAIEDVTGDHEDIGSVRVYRLQDLVEDRRMVILKRHAMELAPEMQVRSMKHPHNLDPSIFYMYIF